MNLELYNYESNTLKVIYYHGHINFMTVKFKFTFRIYKDINYVVKNYYI